MKELRRARAAQLCKQGLESNATKQFLREREGKRKIV